MKTAEWAELLAEINQTVLSDGQFAASSVFTNEQRQARWLGQPGASENELTQLEQRLGCKLPSSYRSFLATSNGFGPISYFIYNLNSTSEIDWLAVKESELVKMWEEGATDFAEDPNLADDLYLRYDDTQPPEGVIRPTHMQQCLMISDWGDAGFLALNPAVQHEGEWEAWHFANWMPGARRYRSFVELLKESLAETRELGKS